MGVLAAPGAASSTTMAVQTARLAHRQAFPTEISLLHSKDSTVAPDLISLKVGCAGKGLDEYKDQGWSGLARSRK
jgi:hypothetical protein